MILVNTGEIMVNDGPMDNHGKIANIFFFHWCSRPVGPTPLICAGQLNEQDPICGRDVGFFCWPGGMVYIA